MLLKNTVAAAAGSPTAGLTDAACRADRRHRDGQIVLPRPVRALGVPVIDADVLAREAVGSGTPGLAAVVARFGPELILPDGTLDRAALGRIVFADRAARADLEAIVHPESTAGSATGSPTCRRARASRLPTFRCCSRPATSTTSTGDRLRLRARGAAAASPDTRWPERADAAARSRRSGRSTRRSHAGDYVIRTDGTFADTDAQVRQVYDALRLTADAES